MASLLGFVFLAVCVSAFVDGLGYWPVYSTATAEQGSEGDDRQAAAYYTYPPNSLPGIIAGQVQQVVDYIYGEEEEDEESEEVTTTPAPTTTRRGKPGKGRK